MDIKIIEFLRSFILAENDADSIRGLKEVALDLLIGDGKNRVTIKYPGWNAEDPKKYVTISRLTYGTVSDFLRLGRKIDAIKELRNDAKLGLKEAKEATDIWDFSL